MILTISRTALAIAFSSLSFYGCESHLHAPQVTPITAPANEPVVPAPTSEAPAQSSAPVAIPASSSPSEPPLSNAESVVKALRPKFRACYNAELKTNPKAAGSMVATASIGADGSVTLATASRAEGLADATVECVLDLVRGAKFEPNPEIKTLNVPVKFIQASNRPVRPDAGI